MESRLTQLQAVALCGCICVGSAVGVRLTLPDSHVAAWWPASAIGVCLLLLTPRRHRLTYLVLIALLTAVGNAVGGRPLEVSGVFGVANAVEVLLVVWWLTRGRTEAASLRSWTDLLHLVLASAIGSSCIAAAGVLVVVLDDRSQAWYAGLAVFCTHMAAAMVLIPLAMVRPGNPKRATSLEMAVNFGLLLALTTVVFWPGQVLPLLFVLFPVLVWSAARFSPLANSLALVAVWLTIAVCTYKGGGPIPSDVGPAKPELVGAVTQAFVFFAAAVQATFMLSAAQERQSASEVRRNEERLRRVLESARGTAMMSTDPEGTITWFSTGAEQLLGYRSEEVVGRSTPLLLYPPEEVSRRADELGIAPGFNVLTHELGQGASYETRDWTCLLKDGTRRLSTLTITAIVAPDGAPTGYLAVVGDISDERESQQALLSALQKESEALSRMREADQVKTDFVSSVSHELRTPITSIVGYTELLGEGIGGPLNASQRDIVERIDRNGRRLLRLIEDLLTLANIEAGTVEFQRAPVDLCAAVGRAAEEVSARLPGLEIDLAAELPPAPVIVDGDADQLERLVLNLLSNALKFTDPGGHVRVQVTSCDDRAVLCVADDGMGIPSGEQKSLFDRFFRASTARSSEIQGTGLGLSIVRSITEAHEGTVTLSSREGVGTTIKVTLPVSGPRAGSA